MAGGLISPEELRRVAEEKEMAKLREALEKKRKMDEELHQFHETFMTRETHPEVFNRVSRLVKGAAEGGEREVLVLRFPSEYCTDGGRAINNFDPNWPDTLTGFAKRAFDFFEQELKPHGYHARAQIMDFPGGRAGRRRPLSQVVSQPPFEDRSPSPGAATGR